MTSPDVVSELRRIASEHGGELLPADVVAAARPKSSPLHSKFEWDDTEAAERYRIWQARQLISVTVEYIGHGEDTVLSRVFVSLTSDRREDGGYRSLVSVMSNRKQREELLCDALEELNRVKLKYSELQELAEVFAAIRKVRAPRELAPV